jgi:hypothetical protein
MKTKVSIGRIIYEIVYWTVLFIVGIYSGYYISRLSIEVLNKTGGFFVPVFHDTNMSQEP